MVRLLLNKGAKLDRDFGSVPMAVTLDRREIFAALVRAGAPIGIPLMCSLLPLFHSSTLRFFISCVKYLPSDVADEQGRTPLHIASLMNRVEIVLTVSFQK